MLQQLLRHPFLMLAREGVQDVCRIIPRLDTLVHQLHCGLEVQPLRNQPEEIGGRGGDLLGCTLGDQIFGHVSMAIRIGM